MRALAVLTASIIAGALVTSPAAFATPKAHHGHGWRHNPHATDEACPRGKKVLNVVRRVINAVDSGTGLNQYGQVWWAESKYVQRIKVVQTGPDTFCATLTSVGRFKSVGGNSPGCGDLDTCDDPEGQLDAGVHGTFKGGAIDTFTFDGEFNPDDLRTRGSLGTYDANCNPMTGCPPGSVFFGYRDAYFPGYTGQSLPWWGWKYRTKRNGTWVNKIDGNLGDITN